jgi:uncharacterized protein YjbI with pentapeptide repeats
METIEIKQKGRGILFSHTCENNSIRKTVEFAVNKGLRLYNVDLRSADLSGADLIGAIIIDSDLRGADLSGADMMDIEMMDVNLSGANLSGADLNHSLLSDINMSGADLTGVKLSGVDLSEVDLTGIDLKNVDLSEVKADFFEVLDKAKPEVEGLKQALLEGKVDGRVYEGACACLVGTIANMKGVDYRDIKGVQPNSNRPIERWFLGIGEGHTPKNNPMAEVAVMWIEEYQQKELV